MGQGGCRQGGGEGGGGGDDVDEARESMLKKRKAMFSSGSQRASNKSRREAIQREDQLSGDAAVGIERRPGLTPKQTNKEKKEKAKHN